MCGIVGIAEFSPAESKIPPLKRMLGLIRHRGPDSFGVYVDENVGLGSARLSILDLEGGDQPICNEDRTLWVVYNGEIFNYPELRVELEAGGHRFYTRTDTELLVHLYEDHGFGFLEKLNGQFAFALWDKKRKLLFLARDRLGIRPLFYHRRGSGLVFGSEIKAIFADPAVPREINPHTVADVFTCWSPVGADTAFRGVEQLLPGHYAVFESGALRIAPYWELVFTDGRDRAQRPEESYREELEELLLDATRIRLRADVPVGAYLSGGLDSTYVTALVKKRFDNRLRTFSVSFTDGRFDEAPFQETAVKALATDHSLIRCTDRDIGENLPRVIWHTEVPLTRTAPVPLFLLSGLVRESGFKVVLTGEGADELFAGYDIFKEDRIRRFWARRPGSTLRPTLLRRLYPDIFSAESRKAASFLEAFFRKNLEKVDSPIYSHRLRWENTARIKAFFSEEFRRRAEAFPSLEERVTAALPSDFMRWHPLSRAQFLEITLFLSNYLLSSQGDRAAMGHSVEGRFPFLDYRVVQFGCRLPPRLRLNGLADKYLLRQAAREVIPPAIAARPKQPYRAPISRCFLGGGRPDYADELLSPQALRRFGCFDPLKVGKLIDKGRKQDGGLLSERENMALVGIVSTQLLISLFLHGDVGLTQPVAIEPKIFRG
ncbi:MAG: asparagine synthase (glutamine-hydrolyzing) [Desulfobacterales bacterium]